MSDKEKNDENSTFSSLQDSLGIEDTEKTEVSYQDLEKKALESQKKSEENWEKYLRAVADADNIRKRMEREIENARKFSVDRIIKDLLPVIDSLEQGLQIAPQDHDALKSMHEGMEMTLKILQTTLERYGVTLLNPEGEAYDPHFHEAMSMQENAESKSGTILMVIQKGYALHQRVLRPARVIVCK